MEKDQLEKEKEKDIGNTLNITNIVSVNIKLFNAMHKH